MDTPLEPLPEDQRHGMVVGIDGSDAAQAALTWASTRTDRFGPIRPLHTWDYPLAALAPSPFGPGAVPPAEEMEEAARAAAEELVDLGDVPCEPVEVQRGDAATVLVEAARSANLLVVGTRGRGPVRANVIGSTSRHCADHSPVPLVIVPTTKVYQPKAKADRVVVGVDGSEHSLDALRWAAQYAPADAEIVAVTAWQTPVDGPILYGVNRFDVRALRSAAQTIVNEAVDKACAEVGVDPDRIQRSVAEGDPRWVLQGMSDEADLLVLGRRGRTGLAHFFLGSATTALIHRPHCPIAVVP